MKQSQPRLEPELRALLAPGKIKRHAPHDVRMRALSNARAIIAAGGRIPTATVLQFPRARVARRRAPLWIPLAASVAVAAAVSVAAVVLRTPAPRQPLIASPVSAVPRVVVKDQRSEVAAVEPPRPVTQSVASASPVRAAPTGSDGPSLPAELDLLSRAHAAYTRADFSRALVLIAEHARRFPSGHLAEEREALRVRSLARSGHADESRGAEAAFTRRFPRSVLLAHADSTQSPK